MSPHIEAIVRELCGTIRQTGDYSLLPVLADQLDKGNYEDAETITALRDPTLDPIEAQRYVALLYSDETAAAVRWIEEFADGLRDDPYADDEGTGELSDEVCYTWLMEAAARYAADETSTYVGGRMDLSSLNMDEFWIRYTIVTGRAAPEDGYAPFRCAC